MEGNLQVKEVQVKGGLAGERLVVCYNPPPAERDREERERMVEKLREMAGLGKGVPGEAAVGGWTAPPDTRGTVELERKDR